MEPGAAVSESVIIDALRSLDPRSAVREGEMQGYTMLEEILRNIYKTRSGIDSETQENKMAEINVDNMDKNAELFMEKMGFAHDSEGLELSEEQLVNFLLLCHQMEYGVGEEEEEHDDGVKVKIMKVHSGDMKGMMDEMLGHGGPMMGD